MISDSPIASSEEGRVGEGCVSSDWSADGCSSDLDLHQRFEALCQRRLAAADRTQQIQDLLAFLEPLGSVAEEADDPLDRFFHAVKFSEARIAPDRPVHEDAPKPLIMRCVDDLRLAYRR